MQADVGRVLQDDFDLVFHSPLHISVGGLSIAGNRVHYSPRSFGHSDTNVSDSESNDK